MKLPAVILAGGLGTRIASVAGDKPKSLIEFCGKPFLYWQLDLLSRNGVREVILCLSHKSEQIIEYISHENEFKMNIRYSIDGDTQLGTGGSVKKASSLINGPFFVLYGDSFLLTDFSRVQDFYLNQKRRGLMTTIHYTKTYEKPNIQISSNQILNYSKSISGKNFTYVDYGLSILTSDCFSSSQGIERFDLVDVFSHLLLRNELVGFEVGERYFEIGSPYGVSEFKKYLERERSAKSEFY